MAASAYTITPVSSDQDLVDIKVLFTAYVEWLDLDLSFQDYQSEVDNVAARYGPPTGGVFLARRTETGEALGCVAFKALHLTPSSRSCELKRLYVTPAGRGLGLGRALGTRAILEAREQGYQVMKLDTLPSTMGAAVRLYEELGFVECEKYYDTPLVETKFMELQLSSLIIKDFTHARQSLIPPSILPSVQLYARLHTTVDMPETNSTKDSTQDSTQGPENGNGADDDGWFTCIGEAECITFAWEGEGVWVLKETEETKALMKEYGDSHGSIDNLDQHLEMVKNCGGVWFADPMDSPDAALAIEDHNAFQAARLTKGD
ncbi:hypothetical protein MBLNU457_g0606t1 [Dothideomycetes sp. NU457]